MQAQGPSDDVTSAEILVRVTFDDERSAGDQIRVELMNETEIMVSESRLPMPKARCTFMSRFPGGYTVQVSGTPIQGTTTATFPFDDMDKSKTVFVHVKPHSDVASAMSKPSTRPVTSAAELRIPGDAQKAFHKGMDAWEHNDFQKAAE